MAEDDVRAQLLDDNRRKIFRALLDGSKSASEIRKSTGLSEAICSDALHKLEQNRAIKFEKGTWMPTEKGLESYKKYYG